MVPPRLLQGLISLMSPADWLPCHLQLLASSTSLLHRWWLWLPSLARLRCPYCSDGLKLLLVPLLVSPALAEVILSPATFSCIARMPMKGEILVGTMEKTQKSGVFLKSALIETIFLS